MVLEYELLRELEFMIFQNRRITKEKIDKIINQHPLFLVAYDGERPIGFKLGYVEEALTFYSWLGGVHPEYRKQGIAQTLLNMQEETVRALKMKKITFRTYDRFPAMIKLGQKNGYMHVKSESDGNETKYWYEKSLS